MTYLQSLDNALDLFIEFIFCNSDFYFPDGSKNCMVATYIFSSVYSKASAIFISMTTFSVKWLQVIL